jgi:hypothetical protein
MKLEKTHKLITETINKYHKIIVESVIESDEEAIAVEMSDIFIKDLRKIMKSLKNNK